MNLKETREELEKITKLLDDDENDEYVIVEAKYVVPDQYDYRCDYPASTNRRATSDFNWLRETLEECLEKMEHPYFEELLRKEEMLNALMKRGVEDWEGYEEAYQEVMGKEFVKTEA